MMLRCVVFLAVRSRFEPGPSSRRLNFLPLVLHPSLIQTFSLVPLSCLSLPGRLSQPCVSWIFKDKIPRIYEFFMFQTRTATRSARFLSSSSVLRKGMPFTYKMPIRGPYVQFICIDFVQDLYLREVKSYKPAPKVNTHTISHPFFPPTPILSKLIRTFFPLLFLGSQ